MLRLIVYKFTAYAHENELIFIVRAIIQLPQSRLQNLSELFPRKVKQLKTLPPDVASRLHKLIQGNETILINNLRVNKLMRHTIWGMQKRLLCPEISWEKCAFVWISWQFFVNKINYDINCTPNYCVLFASLGMWDN